MPDLLESLKKPAISKKEIIISAALPALVISLIVGYVNYSWFKRVPSGWHYFGTLQSDMQTYTAIFRELFENGDGFFYGSPNEIREELAPPIFIQLPFVLLGWLWRLSGFPIPLVWEIFRIVVTFFLCFSLTLLLSHYFKEGFLTSVVLSLFGSGSIIFFLSLVKGGDVPPTADGLTGLLAQFYYSELTTHWWGNHIFRILFYPLEIFTHALFFLTLYFLLSHRFVLFSISFFLLWFSGIFAAMELSVILFVFLAIEYLIDKQRYHPRYLLAVFLIVFGFIVYYKIFVPHYPAGKSLEEQHRLFQFPPLTLYDYLTHYILLILPLAFSGLTTGFWRSLKNTSAGRLLLIWAVMVFLFSQNDKFLPRGGLQPPHFLRGYLFLALSLILLRWLNFLMEEFKPKKRLIKTAIILFLVLAMTDSFIFTLCMYERLPHPGVSSIPGASKEIVDYLNTLKETRHILVLSSQRHFDTVILAQTPHRSFLSDIMATPFWNEKAKELQKFLTTCSEETFFNKYKIDTIIVHQDFWGFIDSWRASGGTIILEKQNYLWRVYAYKRFPHSPLSVLHFLRDLGG